MRFKYLLSSCIFLLFNLTQGYATHIVGGEIYYTKLNSSGDYEITMKHYRDCYNGNPQALSDDLNSFIFVYNSDNGLLVATLSINALSNQDLSAPLINPCLVAPGNVCVNEAVFKYTVNLPANTNGYDLVYQRCCRNATIVNIQNPGSVGSTIYAHIPGTNVVTDNSSPRYKNFPPIFICTNDPLHFDNSATDPDGDIIRYELCDAYLGADPNCPKPGSASCPSDAPGPPPYNTVPYSSGFSGGNPITAFPNFQIDSITGLLTGTATQTGQYVLTVCAKEYRNGVLISINRREFQFNVLNCGFPIAAFPTQVDKCTGMDFTFSQSSFNATNFNWNFGDNSTATGGTVNHTYTDTGVYTVTLIATNNNPGCADTVTKLVYAYPKLVPTFTTPNEQCLDDNTTNFSAGGVFDVAATFNWNFGANAVPSNSFLQQPTGVIFTADGTQTISLTVSQFGCSKTVTKNLIIRPEPRPQIIPGTTQCTGDTVDLKIQYGGTNITDTQINQGTPLPNYISLGNGKYQLIYSDTGVYTVSIIATNTWGCVDTVAKKIKVYPKFTPQFVAPSKQCLKGNNFSFSVNTLQDSTATYSWYFDNSTINTTLYGSSVNGISFNIDGLHQVILEGNKGFCTGRDTQKVFVIPQPISSIKTQDQFCEGLTYHFSNQSQLSDMYYWDFGVNSLNSDISTQINPTYQYPDTGNYYVMLVAISENMCYDTSFIDIRINPLVKAYFPPPSSQCLDVNNFNFMAQGYHNGNATTFNWSFPPEANTGNSSLPNVNGIIFNTSGSFPITLTIQEFGCTKTHTDTAYVNEPPKAAFKIPNAKDCSPVTVAFKDSSRSVTTYTYLWNFGDGTTATSPNPTHTYTTAGNYSVSLIIQNEGGCTRRDTFKLTNAVTVFGLPKADLLLDSVQRSAFEPFIKFTDISIDAEKCVLDFGDGNTSNICTILHTYPDTGWYAYIQIVTNEFGCKDTLKGKIYIRPDFAFYVPNAFTPNGDFDNPIFKPSVFGVNRYEFNIFDRWGLEIFSTTDPVKGWDGTYKSKPSPQDVYVYRIKYLTVFGQEKTVVGTFTLIR